MRALTLTQPWASLIVKGHKTIELRAWNTKYRGRVLIRASRETARKFTLPQGYELFPSNWPDIIPNSAIIGAVDLIGVRDYESVEHVEIDFPRHLAKAYFTWEEFRKGKAHGFILANPVEFKEPISISGRLSLWNVPVELEPKVMEQLHGAHEVIH